MKIYCSGIGGAGLSAYAALMKDAGHDVRGSDREQSPFTQSLEEQGFAISYNQDGASLTEDVDLFVYSEAIPEDAPERIKAKELGIKSVSYFAALGAFSKDYTTIAVCGTHGKSSTTAMVATALVDAGLDPTVVVGTKVPQLGGNNYRAGKSQYFVVEACEYRRSFLHFHPDSILMTNADGDHFDAFAGVEDYQDAFGEFLQKLPEDGVVITHMGDEDCRKVVAISGCQAIDADQYPLPDLSIPGKHMQENAQLVLALADRLGIDVKQSLKEFSGTWRRFERKGEWNNIPVIDDYAHHPIEIKATIQSAKEKYSDKRLVILFQPHLHDRTLRLYEEFCSCFKDADVVVLTDPYDARPDVETGMVDMRKFAEDIQTECVYTGDLTKAKELLCSKILQQGDILIVMGAGDVTQVATGLTTNN